MNDNSNIKSQKLGEKAIGKLIFEMSFPMMISMFMLACYNIVDSIFVSRISEEALSAVSLAAPVQFLMVALNIGTNVGMTANISRTLGEKHFDRTSMYARHGLFIAIIYSVITMMFGLFFVEKFFISQTSDVRIITAGVDYLKIICLFSSSAYLVATFEKMLQATGNSIGSMSSQMIGAIANIILDPIMIFGLFGFPALGVKGAAIATVTGQYLGVILSFILNKIMNKGIIDLNIKNFRLNPEIIFNIYRIAFPSIVMQSIGSFMILGLNTILIRFQSAVAILGIYYKVQNFILMPIFGLNSGMIPIVSFNFGARNKDRIKKAVKISLISSVLIGLLGSCLMFFGSNTILTLFNASENMYYIGNIAFRIIAIQFPLAAYSIILGSVMQATQREIYTLITSIIRQIVFLLPCAYILAKTTGITGVWFAFPISDFVAFILTAILYKNTIKTRINVL